MIKDVKVCQGSEIKIARIKSLISLLKIVLISLKNFVVLEYFIVFLKKTFIKFMVFLTLGIFNYFSSLTLAESIIVFFFRVCI